jgi:hypothetical protein
MLAGINEFLLSVAAAVIFLIVIEVGFRLGRNHSAGVNDAVKDHIKGLQTALLGLLALLLAFNFAMASSRFDARKALIQEEVNNIATAWQRAQLFPARQRHEISDLLKRYVSSRIDFMRAGTDMPRLDAASADASVIEAEIWKVTTAMVEEGTQGPHAGLFMEAINNMVNLKWTRWEAMQNHVPETFLYLLFVVAVGALGFIGYAYGLNGIRHHLSTAIFVLLITLVLGTILDADRPRGGMIRVNEDGLLRLQTALEQGRL